MWNVDLQRDLARTLNVGVGYAGTRGRNLYIQRAPNRGANGVAIADVQPFIWEESGGRPTMHALSLRLQERALERDWRGLLLHALQVPRQRVHARRGQRDGGTTTRTSMPNGRVELRRALPLHRQRQSRVALRAQPAMAADGPRRMLLGGWNWTVNFTLASGSPFSARVTGAAANVAQGLNVTLRANYNGEAIQLDDLDDAALLQHGGVRSARRAATATRRATSSSGRYAGHKHVAAEDHHAPNARSITVRAQANNVFNNVQWVFIDTVVNSPTFGQVTSVRSMRASRSRSGGLRGDDDQAHLLRLPRRQPSASGPSRWPRPCRPRRRPERRPRRPRPRSSRAWISSSAQTSSCATRTGKLVRGLTRHDFVMEDGQPQTVSAPISRKSRTRRCRRWRRRPCRAITAIRYRSVRRAEEHRRIAQASYQWCPFFACKQGLLAEEATGFGEVDRKPQARLVGIVGIVEIVAVVAVRAFPCAGCRAPATGMDEAEPGTCLDDLVVNVHGLLRRNVQLVAELSNTLNGAHINITFQRR